MTMSKRQRAKWVEKCREQLLESLTTAHDAGDLGDVVETFEELYETIDYAADSTILDNRYSWRLFATTHSLAAARKKYAELELPSLVGSEKQVRWAREVRKEAFVSLLQSEKDEAAELLQAMQPVTSASYFIDLRGAADKAEVLLRSRWAHAFPYLLDSEGVVELRGPKVEEATALKAQVINFLTYWLSADYEDEEKDTGLLASKLAEVKACNDAERFTWRLREDFGRPLLRKEFPSRTTHRFPGEREDKGIRLSAGPFAGCLLYSDRLEKVGGGWVEAFTYDTVRIDDCGTEENIAVERVLSDEPLCVLSTRWQSLEKWQAISVASADVAVSDSERVVTLRNSARYEGLRFYVKPSQVKPSRATGMMTVLLPSDGTIRLYGGERKQSASVRAIVEDCAIRLEEPGESRVAVWSSLSLHSSHMEKLRSGKAVVVELPMDVPEVGGWVFFHPAKLATGNELRFHGGWTWTLTSPQKEQRTVDVAEMTELLKGWASEPLAPRTRVTRKDGTVDVFPTELQALRDVEVLNDLADDLAA